ncbi:DUF1298 domain-containing protein [Amycolatopsis acidicola]|uniref:diacylglycerol O-acyltransferase n=1 Tax=Amycolatopsis acidicola TaxID=2596893 RepID=A0A5N0V1H4_9PSEU|nr:WS/DGAT domain-containing protein [Amycolatopsis acidicola]KAA9160236.1 DUF1298 domain-containing protein [Amycolatopsis acidicola]
MPRRWEDDPEFRLDRHLLVRELPRPGDAKGLQDFVAAERGRELDPRHPLWSITLLRGYGRGDALVMRSHHAMADGIRLTQVLFSLLDPLEGAGPEPGALVGGWVPHHVRNRHPVAGLGSTVLRAVDTAGERLNTLAGKAGPFAEAAVAVPAAAGAVVTGAAAGALAVLEPALPPSARRAAGRVATAGMTVGRSVGGLAKLFGPRGGGAGWAGEPGREKTVCWGEPMPLDTITAIGRQTGATVNDVCTALVAGAFDRYEAGGGRRDMVWMVPVSLRRFDADLPAKLGNHFSLVLLRMPLGRAAFPERVAEVNRRIARIRDSWEPVVNLVLQAVVSQSPPPVSTVLARHFTDRAAGVLTNVPGPRERMALAGAEVGGVVGWAPCGGRQAVTVCVFSYAGKVYFGFGTDRKLIPDPERLVDALGAELRAAETTVSPLDG